MQSLDESVTSHENRKRSNLDFKIVIQLACSGKMKSQTPAQQVQLLYKGVSHAFPSLWFSQLVSNT
uniref:Uncharacterized protein n=1 Tax=Romanomermis culicivorax TaxID=13658 RepID=A0A915KLB3_ROMCU